MIAIKADYANLIEEASNYVSINLIWLVQIKTEGVIRRKVLKLGVKDGEVYYKKKRGEVCYLGLLSLLFKFSGRAHVQCYAMPCTN